MADPTSQFSQATAVPGDTVDWTVTGVEVNQPTGIMYSTEFNPTNFYDNTEQEDFGLETNGTEMSGPYPQGTLRSSNGTISSTTITHQSSNVYKHWRTATFTDYPKTSDFYAPPANHSVPPPNSFWVVGDNNAIGYEVIDPIVEPTYTFSPFLSVEENGYWQKGKSYDVTVYEVEDYESWFAGYKSTRNTGLLGTGNSSIAGINFNDKEGLINEAGLTDLFDSERVYDSDFYRDFPAVVNAAVDSGVISNVAVVSSELVENTNGDPDTDLWYRRDTYKRTYRFTVAEDAPDGTQYLVFNTFKDDTVEDFPSADVTQTYQPVLQVAARAIFIGVAPPFPPDRPDDYDEDAEFDPATQDWTDFSGLGGGRYRKHLVVLSGQAKIYFGEA